MRKNQLTIKVIEARDTNIDELQDDLNNIENHETLKGLSIVQGSEQVGEFLLNVDPSHEALALLEVLEYNYYGVKFTYKNNAGVIYSRTMTEEAYFKDAFITSDFD